MPLDTNIPLSGKPMPELPDYGAQQMQTVQLADLIRRQRLNQQLAPLQLQQAQGAAQLQQMQLEQAKKQQALQESDQAAMAQAHQEANGNLIKMPSMPSWKNVSPGTSIAYQKELEGMLDAQSKRSVEDIKLDLAKDEAVVQAFQGVSNAQELNESVDNMVAKGYIPPQKGAEYKAAGYTGKDSVDKIILHYESSKSLLDESIKRQGLETAKAVTRKDLAEAAKLEAEAAALKNPPTAEQYGARIDAIAGPKPDAETLRAAAATKNQIAAHLAFGGPEARKKADSAMDKFTDDLASMGRAKVSSEGKVTLNMGGLTEDDLKAEGEMAARTGTSPSMGMGNMGVRNKIMHYKQQYARDHNLSPADLINMQVEYNGGKTSYTNLLKAYDMVSSYESTAQGNLGRALSTATKIVDTGSPVFNLPLREAAKRLTGSPQQAAFNTALLTARNEIARILTASPTSLGGVVSDESKKEVEDIMAKDYSLAQLVSAANILKADLTQRKTSMKSQLDQRKSEATGSEVARTQAATSAAANTAATADTGEGKGGKGAKSYVQYSKNKKTGHVIGATADGKWWDINTGAEVK